MKKHSARQYAIALWRATKGLKGKDLESAIFNFASLLSQQRMLKKANVIINHFISYSKKQDGIQDLELTSAYPLSEKTIDSIKKIFGKKIEVVCGTDRSLIGGVIIKTRDRILDASIKTQLNKLKQSLA